jgi:hypothetical protein
LAVTVAPACSVLVVAVDELAVLLEFEPDAVPAAEEAPEVDALEAEAEVVLALAPAMLVVELQHLGQRL